MMMVMMIMVMVMMMMMMIRHCVDDKKINQFSINVNMVHSLSFSSSIMPSLCKNREMILASIERRDHDQRRHIQAMCSILHPSVPVVQPNNIRYDDMMLISDDYDDDDDVMIMMVMMMMMMMMW